MVLQISAFSPRLHARFDIRNKSWFCKYPHFPHCYERDLIFVISQYVANFRVFPTATRAIWYSYKDTLLYISAFSPLLQARFDIRNTSQSIIYFLFFMARNASWYFLTRNSLGNVPSAILQATLRMKMNLITKMAAEGRRKILVYFAYYRISPQVRWVGGGGGGWGPENSVLRVR